MTRIRHCHGSHVVPNPAPAFADDEDTDIQGNDKPSNNGNSQITVTDVWPNENSTLKSFPCEENTGIRLNIPTGDDPPFYLRLLMTDDLIKGIAKSTNTYAQHFIKFKLLSDKV